MGIRFDEIVVGMTLYRSIKIASAGGTRRPPRQYEEIKVLSRNDFGCDVTVNGQMRRHLKRAEMQELNRAPPKAKRSVPVPRSIAGAGRRAH